MEACVHTHILYVGEDTNSKQAKKKLEELSKQNKDFSYRTVNVENVGATEVSPPYLLADEGKFTNMQDIEWFVKQYSKGNLPTRVNEDIRRISFLNAFAHSISAKETIDLALSATGLFGGLGLVLLGVWTQAGFYSWTGVICMALGAVHFLSSPGKPV